ncbi:MAG: ABC transporter ATP-binding protein [Herbaspirillum sp.]|nr:ABC transporter ATP-binding protein [Herbaspirillum sp.]
MSVVISPKIDLPPENPFLPGPPGTHITIRGLTKYFAGWPLYENFDLDIPKQQIVSVFGPNGCGKSTLINMIAGLIPIDAGQILFDGKSLAQTKIGYVFQNYRDAMFPWLRTIDNIAYPLKLEGKSKAEIKHRVDELVASFDVKFDLMRYPYELSGGQQQTASIMRALAPGPEVLFLDEPFSALDFEMTLFIREKLQQVFMQTGTTMVLVSHDLEEAVYLADQILLLTKRPTAVADILHYQDARPRTVETLSQAGFIAAKKQSMEIFQREVRKPARMQAPGTLALS